MWQTVNVAFYALQILLDAQDGPVRFRRVGNTRAQVKVVKVVAFPTRYQYIFIFFLLHFIIIKKYTLHKQYGTRRI